MMKWEGRKQTGKNEIILSAGFKWCVDLVQTRATVLHKYENPVDNVAGF